MHVWLTVLCVCVCMYVCTYVCTCIYTYLCIHVCILYNAKELMKNTHESFTCLIALHSYIPLVLCHVMMSFSHCIPYMVKPAFELEKLFMENFCCNMLIDLHSWSTRTQFMKKDLGLNEKPRKFSPLNILVYGIMYSSYVC